MRVRTLHEKRRPYGGVRMKMRPAVSIVAALALVAAMAASGCSPPPTTPTATAPPVSPPTTPVTPPSVRAAAAAALKAFESKDGAALVPLVHDTKGVRFSPYAYVDVVNDITLTRSEIADFWRDDSVRLWGAVDGTGDPILMSSSAYYERYVLDRDFSAATVSVNQDLGVGNTVNNVATAYPDAERVEYYVAPTMVDGEPSNDWTALRLVFELVDGRYYLVGVIHDQWTI